ncbi:MAG TPA: translocation/assembly module TamB domain-containing protein, partial [Adhaeribacter sp.]|nr:translocation/assembly module TamB domain-containing protein [Adhaeribacter sp.]
QRVTMTEVLQLSPNALEEDPALRRPYPVNVLMGLSGNLLNPEIKLDLEFADISPIETALQPFISSIRNDEQELNRQVFSLMAFRRFSPVGEFSLGSNAGTDALNSLSEWASNALSYWISQVDSNLEVDIGLTGGLTGTDVMTRIGYTFLDGRLRVTRESLITSQSTTYNSNAAAFGDWRAEYYLRPDGKLRLKLQYVTSGANYLNNNFTTSSLSLMHTEQFDTFGELFSRKRLSRKAEKERKEREEALKYQIESDPRRDYGQPPVL